jgi:hypothetical protein
MVVPTSSALTTLIPRAAVREPMLVPSAKWLSRFVSSHPCWRNSEAAVLREELADDHRLVEEPGGDHAVGSPRISYPSCHRLAL